MAHIQKIVTKEVLGFTPHEVPATIALSTAVRALMQNWRQGTVACKDRSEVAFANRKPW